MIAHRSHCSPFEWLQQQQHHQLWMTKTYGCDNVVGWMSRVPCTIIVKCGWQTNVSHNSHSCDCCRSRWLTQVDYLHECTAGAHDIYIPIRTRRTLSGFFPPTCGFCLTLFAFSRVYFQLKWSCHIHTHIREVEVRPYCVGQTYGGNLTTPSAGCELNCILVRKMPNLNMERGGAELAATATAMQRWARKCPQMGTLEKDDENENENDNRLPVRM